MPSIEERRNTQGEITSFRLTVSDGIDCQGRQIKRRVTWTPPTRGMSEAQMRREAKAAAYKFEEMIKNGIEVDRSVTFEEYAKYALELKERQGVTPQTLTRYYDMLPQINQAIGRLKLCDIRPRHLNDFYKQLSENGSRRNTDRAVAKSSLSKKLRHDKISKAEVSRRAHISASTVTAATRGEPIMISSARKIAEALKTKMTALFNIQKDEEALADKTILEYHRLISSILAQADKEMLVPYNAARKATPPRPVKPVQDYYQPEEMQLILEALEEAPLLWKTITYLLIDTGCRRGEIVGLKWEKVDFESGIVIIDCALLYTPEKGIYEGPTKTRNFRALRLAPQSLAVLKQWKEKYDRMKLENSASWTETPYVFVKENGMPIHPDSITDWLNLFSQQHDELPHLHPHAFRHTAASTLIANGIDLVTTAAELGHANATTTATIYAHQIALARAKAATVRAGVFATLDKLKEKK